MRTLAVLALMVAVGTSPGPLDGTWSGDRLVVTIKGDAATLATDCGGGRIAGALRPDAAGTFSVVGVFEDYGMGATAGDRIAASPPARFDGQVDGGTMVLTITRPGTARSFRLTRGGRGLKLIRCA